MRIAPLVLLLWTLPLPAEVYLPYPPSGHFAMPPSHFPHVQPPAPRVSPGPRGVLPVAPDSSLVPAGTGGNPGFTFSVRGRTLNPNSIPYQSCQATGFSCTAGELLALTAAHCVADASDLKGDGNLGGPYAHLGVLSPDKKIQKEIQIQTAPVHGLPPTAIAHLHPDYVRSTNITSASRTPTGGISVITTASKNDIAILQFKIERPCDQLQIPLLRLYPDLPHGKSVFIGSRWDRTSRPATLKPLSNYQDRTGVQIAQGGIEQGDSGGPLFTSDGLLLGALSTGEAGVKRSFTANYAALESTRWALAKANELVGAHPTPSQIPIIVQRREAPLPLPLPLIQHGQLMSRIEYRPRL